MSSGRQSRPVRETLTINGDELEELVAAHGAEAVPDGGHVDAFPSADPAGARMAERRTYRRRSVAEGRFWFSKRLESAGPFAEFGAWRRRALDAGIYPVSFASMIFGTEPEKIWSTAHIGETGVDEQFSVILSYESGKTASLNGAIRLGLTNEAYIYGTNGYIHIPSFLNATSASLHVDGEEPVVVTDDRQEKGIASRLTKWGSVCWKGGWRAT